MRMFIPRAIFSTFAAIGGSRRRNKWWWRRHGSGGQLGSQLARDSVADPPLLLGMNRRWWILNGTPWDPWPLSVSPLQKHITTTTWASAVACADAVTSLSCCLRRIKRGHFGIVVVVILSFWLLQGPYESETFALRKPHHSYILLFQLCILC